MARRSAAPGASADQVGDGARRLRRQRVVIRMYRHGVGDCFLLTFHGARGSAAHVLIDCGILVGVPDGEDRMRAVVEDIRAATAGRGRRGRLDLVIVTHEHWDHVSGFAQAQDLFDQIDIGEVWMGWTESPQDQEAQALDRLRDAALAGLERVVPALAADERIDTSRLEALLGFSGLAFDAGARRRGSRVREARNRIREAARNGTRFLEPGNAPLPLPGVAGVRAFVLGPPRGTMLKKTDGSATRREVYALGATSDETLMFALGAADQAGGGADADAQQARPFDRRHVLEMEEAGGDPRLARYFAGSDDAPDDEAWRRIDDVTATAAEALALRLDHATNNTSLALAIELEDGQVLLFPGDAQIGSWLSWQELRWPAGRAEVGAPTISVADLLARTVLYKVGHHGSHNATLAAGGLDLMRHPDLVAMLPVDERFVREKKGWDDMPRHALVEALLRQTRGRLIRMDQRVHVDGDLPALATSRPEAVSEAGWRRFLQRLGPADDEAYVEYTIDVAGGVLPS